MLLAVQQGQFPNAVIPLKIRMHKVTGWFTELIIKTGCLEQKRVRV